MSITRNFERYNNPDRKWEWLVFIRAAVGVLLLIKGIIFLSHAEELERMILNTPFKNIDKFSMFLAFYITVSHLFGGILLVAGLYTRTAAIMNIPILLGAVIFVNRPSVLSVQPEFILSSIMLVVLIIFLIHGGGAFSIDRYVKKHLL